MYTKQNLHRYRKTDREKCLTYLSRSSSHFCDKAISLFFPSDLKYQSEVFILTNQI